MRRNRTKRACFSLFRFLFRLIKKRSFHLLCVLDLFSECWQSTQFQIFFFILYMGPYFSHEPKAKFYNFKKSFFDFAGVCVNVYMPKYQLVFAVFKVSGLAA